MEQAFIVEGDKISLKLVNGEVIVGTLDRVMAGSGQTEGILRLTDATILEAREVYAVIFVYERHILMVTK